MDAERFELWYRLGGLRTTHCQREAEGRQADAAELQTTVDELEAAMAAYDREHPREGEAAA